MPKENGKEQSIIISIFKLQWAHTHNIQQFNYAAQNMEKISEVRRVCFFLHLHQPQLYAYTGIHNQFGVSKKCFVSAEHSNINLILKCVCAAAMAVCGEMSTTQRGLLLLWMIKVMAFCRIVGSLKYVIAHFGTTIKTLTYAHCGGGVCVRVR